MTAIQYAAIQALAGAAALSILLFDKRGRTHKPLYALLAYLTFVQMTALVITAHFRLAELTDWLLVLPLAIYTGSILLAGGNVSKIHTRIHGAMGFRLPKTKTKQQENQHENRQI